MKKGIMALACLLIVVMASCGKTGEAKTDAANEEQISTESVEIVAEQEADSICVQESDSIDNNDLDVPQKKAMMKAAKKTGSKNKR